MSELSPIQILKAVQYALNAIPNRRLDGCPHGIANTYMLARHVDWLVHEADHILEATKWKVLTAQQRTTEED